MRPITRALTPAALVVVQAGWLAGTNAAAAASQDDTNRQVDQTYTAADGVVHYAFDPSRLPGYEVQTLIGWPEVDREDREAVDGLAGGGTAPVNTTSYTNTRANFTNTLFCNPFASTYTNHSKSGDCASLLSSGYYLDTP